MFRLTSFCSDCGSSLPAGYVVLPGSRPRLLRLVRLVLTSRLIDVQYEVHCDDLTVTCGHLEAGVHLSWMRHDRR